MPAILIVEDEAKMRRLLELNLGEDGFTTFSAGDAETGLKLLRENPIDLVLTDLKLPGMNGLEFLQTIKRQNAALPVVVMTAFGSVETAVEAMKAGASDYVLKPFSLTEMRMVIHKELDVRNLREENRSLREALGKRYAHPNIVARSPKMQEVLATVERVAPDQRHGSAGRRERRGQGFDRARHSRKIAPRLGAVPQDQQHRHPGKSSGERIVRLRKRSVHRSGRQQARQVRTGRQGNAVSRRDRRRASGHAGEVVARAAGTRVRAPGRHAHGEGRRAPDCRHQQRSARSARARHISRGSLLPLERRAHRHRAAARAQGRHSGSREPVHLAVHGRIRQAGRRASRPRRCRFW